jgi:O-methyltransferase
VPFSEEKYQEIFRRVEPFTVTGPERVRALIESVEYVVRNNISGSLVECGVWRGGSMMAVALTLLELGEVTRELVLYDTFAGSTKPTAADTRAPEKGISGEQLYAELQAEGKRWLDASLNEVRGNLVAVGYPKSKLIFIEGPVEETLRGEIPAEISLLRLDTDWYESTLMELEILYPNLAQHGILIIDDYGEWDGARKATDEYFGKQAFQPFLHRIDYTGRLVIQMLVTHRPSSEHSGSIALTNNFNCVGRIFR